MPPIFALQNSLLEPKCLVEDIGMIYKLKSGLFLQQSVSAIMLGYIFSWHRVKLETSWFGFLHSSFQWIDLLVMRWSMLGFPDKNFCHTLAKDLPSSSLMTWHTKSEHLTGSSFPPRIIDIKWRWLNSFGRKMAALSLNTVETIMYSAFSAQNLAKNPTNWRSLNSRKFRFLDVCDLIGKKASWSHHPPSPIRCCPCKTFNNLPAIKALNSLSSNERLVWVAVDRSTGNKQEQCS